MDNVIEIKVNTEKLLTKYPYGHDFGEDEVAASKYIHMSVVEGTQLWGFEYVGSSILNFNAPNDVDVRWVGRAVVNPDINSVDLVGWGPYNPSKCFQADTLEFNNGECSGTTIASGTANSWYSFEMRVDDYKYTFVWDPGITIENK